MFVFGKEKKRIKIVNQVWCEEIGDSMLRPYRPALVQVNPINPNLKFGQ